MIIVETLSQTADTLFQIQIQIWEVKAFLMSVELQQWTHILVQHVSENAMFSTASWIQLFCTFTFFFSLQLALSFEGIHICVSLLYKPPGYHPERECTQGESQGSLSLLCVM